MRKAQNHSVVGHVGAAVTILGSLLMPAAAGAQVPERPTFAKDVAAIFQEKCQACHRPGQMGPMPLVTYQEVRPWVRSIRTKVSTRMMPPWHLDRTVGIKKFKNDISLTDDQIETIVRWVDQGAALGDQRRCRLRSGGRPTTCGISASSTAVNPTWSCAPRPGRSRHRARISGGSR